jgi:hypothetical protein
LKPIDAIDVAVDDVSTLGLAGAHGDDDDDAFDRWLASMSPDEFGRMLSVIAADEAGPVAARSA